MLRGMAGLIASTVAYFIASYFIKRYLDGIDVPRGFTRTTTIICLSLLVAYGVGALADWAIPG